MKNVKIQIIGLALIVATAVSCNNSNKDKSKDANTATTENVENKEFNIAPIIADYLALKNALTENDSKAASKAGGKLVTVLKDMYIDDLPSGKKKQYKEIAEDARENAEHIEENSGKIDHQREHLEFLSKDILDLISLFGTPQKLYQYHCAEFNNGKGADWISDGKDVKNPYYGKEMSDCGEVVKELMP